MLQPILAPPAGGDGARDEGRGGGDDEGEDPEDDLSPRAVAVRALREVDFDRATGKLSDSDHETLKAKYTAEALAALRAEGAPQEGPAPPAQRAPAVAGPSRFAPRVVSCPTHGVRMEPGAVFCAECGRRLADAPGEGYCARCGSALERDARYCHACGTRVAA